MSLIERELDIRLVPGVSRISIEYLSLPDLIDLDVTQTPELWSRRTITLLNLLRLDVSASTLLSYFRPYIVESSFTVRELPEAIAEGFMGLILLGQLPPQLISLELIDYVGSLPVTVRRLIYPLLLKISFTSDDAEFRETILTTLIDEESINSTSNSALPSILETVPEQLFFVYVSVDYLICSGNVQFVLDHLEHLIITPDTITQTLHINEYAVASLFLHQLFTSQNRTNFKSSGKIEDSDIVDQMMSDIRQCIPSLYTWTQQRLHNLDYMFMKE